MQILTNENRPYDLNRIPEEVEDIRYCVFDTTDQDNMDYYFIPLIFLESFYAPAIVLQIGEYKVQMPLDWSLVACDEDFTDIEIIPLTALNDRGFHTVVYNPLKHMVTHPAEVTIVNVYAEVKWFFPKLRHGTLLVVPLEEGDQPKCALFVKEKNKIPDTLEVSSLFQ
jgi:hypothetical protein